MQSYKLPPYQLTFHPLPIYNFSNVTRLGIVGGVVKVTYDYGIWTTKPEAGSQKLSEVQHKILPGTIEFPEQVRISAYFIV